jgi:hypothetical protein
MGAVSWFPVQPNGARGKPLVRATLGINAPFRVRGHATSRPGKPPAFRDNVCSTSARFREISQPHSEARQRDVRDFKDGSTTLPVVGRSERRRSRGVPDPVAEAQTRARLSSYSPGSPTGPMQGFHRYRASLRRSKAWPFLKALLLATLLLIVIAILASPVRN